MPPSSWTDIGNDLPDFAPGSFAPSTIRSRKQSRDDLSMDAPSGRAGPEEAANNETAADVRSRLLEQYGLSDHDYAQRDHGAFPSRPQHRRGYGSAGASFVGSIEDHERFGGPYPEAEDEANGHTNEPATFARQFTDGMLGDSITDGLLGVPKKRGTTHWLAERAGIKHERLMYIYYYLPITNWMRQYRWRYVRGDLIAALTMASFYIPIALSYASNLAHMPPINGLYSFAFNPLIYAFLGTCPQMVVGPEAAGSLLTGSVVTEAINAGHFADDDSIKAAQVGGMVTGLAGAIILAAGICRLGFLDSVLSRPFLRGFISSIGLVILINQLIPEMGLDDAAAHSEKASHGSPLDSVIFLVENGHLANKATCAVSFGTVGIVLVLRELKRRLQGVKKMGWVVYLPDRFAVVVLSAIFSWQFEWNKAGVDVLGDIRSPKGQVPFAPHFPFAKSNFKHVSDAFTTAFIIALLGFFESCVASKSLGTGTVKVHKVERRNSDGTVEEVEESDGIRGMAVSSNRELVALGLANVIGGCFMALPAFGGYGRSKVNKSTGGKTPMSSIFLSIITVICVLFLLPYFYHIPKGVLSAMITVVSISLLEEAPHDVIFFWKIGGYIELFLMVLIFLTTFFWSLRGGIIVGIIFSLIRLLKHSTRPRIQILGRVPGTRDFENAEVLAQEGSVELIPHCLIVKIPEPLTFANTGSLKDRLRRLEDHGTQRAHPALPSVRSREHNQNIIFDVHGVTDMDYAAAQVLFEIVNDYLDHGTSVLFCRIPSKKSRVWQLFCRTGIVERCGGEQNFFRSVNDALRATERGSTFHELADGSEQGTQAGTTVTHEDDASGKATPSGGH